MCGGIFTSSGVREGGWLHAFIEKLGGNDLDAKKIRTWLSGRPTHSEEGIAFDEGREERQETVEDKLAIVCVKAAYRRQEADTRWASLNVTSRREYLRELSAAATRLADLVSVTTAPPLPPLWMFLNDDHAESLFDLISRDPELASSIWPCGRASAMKKLSAQDADFWGDFSDMEPEARPKTVAASLYTSWDNPFTGHYEVVEEKLRFLRDDTANLMRAFAAHVRTMSLGDEKTEVGLDDTNARVRMAAKAIYRDLIEVFAPDEQPYLITACCVRLLYPESETNKKHWPQRKDVEKWIKGAKKKSPMF